MAVNLLNPGSWGWGNDYPTGGSAQLASRQTTNTTPSPTPYAPAANYYMPAGSPQYSNQQAVANSKNVLGAYTTSPSGGSTGGSTGGGGGSTAPAPSPSNPAPQAPEPSRGPSDQELNDAYNPLFSYLNQAESSLRGDLPTYQQEVNNSYNTSKQILDNGLNSTKRTIDTQLQTGDRQRMDVISEARRLFNELTMSNNQRFGGATSAGQAASELQGREFQRGTFKANQQFQDLSQELGNKKIELDQNYTVSLQQLEDKKTSSLNEINRGFQEKLLQINQMRANTESEKANRRLQALQDYRNQVYSVQLQNYQMQQQLQAYKQQADIQLDNYAKQLQMSGGAATSKYNAFSSGLATPTYSTFGQQTAQTQQPAMTGQIRKDEQPTGAIAPIQQYSPNNTLLDKYQL